MKVCSTYLCVTFERERGREREAYSSGKLVLIPIVKVIFHVLWKEGRESFYSTTTVNSLYSLLSTIPPPTTTAKEVLKLKEVQWQVNA